MLLDEFFTRVQAKKASDLHCGEGYKPFLRINGELVEQKDFRVLSKKDVEEIAAQAVPKEFAKRFGQKSDIDFALNHGDDARFRAHIYYAQKCLNFAFRLLPRKIPSCNELGIPESLIDYVLQQSEGLFIVTGPTGSGKSTTIAALIDLFNQQKNLHIITIEDPVEYTFVNKQSLIKQREVGREDGDVKTFAGALRSALREDPDIIFVGEMRDQETMRLALRAAETGHLVFSTLHTGFAWQIPLRIVNAFPASQSEQIRNQLIYAFRGAIAQRLLARKGGGGRIAAFEILLTNDAVRNLIKENKLQGVRDVMKSSKNADIFRNGIFESTSPDVLEMILLEESIDKLRTQGIID